MKTIGKIFHAALLGVIISCSFSHSKEYAIYKEPGDPKPSDLSEWRKVPGGINATVGSIDERYGKSAVPSINSNLKWEGVTWKGERINAQILLWSSEKLIKVSCEVSDLKDNKNNIIPAGNIKTFFLRYVMTDEFGTACKPRQAVDFDSSIVADVLDHVPCYDLEANSVRPVWVTIDVPENTVPANYSGSLTLKAERQKEVVFNIHLRVQNEILPKPSDWKFHLDLWQNPFAVARYNKAELWSQQHFDLLRPLMEMLANAGQKCITASIIDRPWGGQTYDPYQSMIKWFKSRNGEWSYDYSVFDKWVRFAMDCGINRQINCYTMIPWGNRFTYFDELTNKDSIVTASPGEKQYESLWIPFLIKFLEHLKENGWRDITTIAIDERKMEDMQNLITLIKLNAPGLKISYAGGFHNEINDDLFDLSVASRYFLSRETLGKRSERGFHTTFYICCVEEYPNNFTFSPPAESAFLGWYASANGYDGLLRWAYNSWVRDPLTDSRFRAFPAGDTYIVYPGGRSSVRFERLREGIQDFEKIRILHSRFKDSNSEEAGIKLRRMEAALAKIKMENLKGTPAKDLLNEGKDIINNLSEN